MYLSKFRIVQIVIGVVSVTVGVLFILYLGI